MKLFQTLFIALITVSILGCEDDVYPELEQSESKVVVDAWITNEPVPQTVKITETLPYFTNEFAPGIENAIVYIVEDGGEQFNFLPSNVKGSYVWTPSASQPVLGTVGNNYELHIQWNNIEVSSYSTLNRVPPVDSVTFSFESGSFIPDSYFAEFFARDPVGAGDTYWIKTYKNGSFLNRPNEINLAFDAGTSAGANVDGLYLIQPIRNAINPFETDEKDNLISPYNPGDSIMVEMYSITNEAFNFLTELRIQTDRPGGFAELFAVPLSNIPTNMVSTQDLVLGYFNMSAVSRNAAFLDPNDLPVD